MIAIEIFLYGERHDSIECINSTFLTKYKKVISTIGKPANCYIQVKGLGDFEKPLTDEEILEMKRKLHNNLNNVA